MCLRIRIATSWHPIWIGLAAVFPSDDVKIILDVLNEVPVPVTIFRCRAQLNDTNNLSLS
jgi:hypothetical protein